MTMRQTSMPQRNFGWRRFCFKTIFRHKNSWMCCATNKKWLSSLERGMLLVRRARRWALRKLICKIWRHDDSKTISWHAAFPVRFARLLAALRLNSPLRGSNSGSLWRQHRKPHDGSLATVRAICFRIHHGCIILRTMFYNAVRLHIAKSSWPVSECLSEKLSQAKIQNIKKQK